MACLLRPGIFFLAMAVQASSHWVQELELYDEAKGGAWTGCVLRTCRSPKKFQTRCPAADEAQPLGSDMVYELAQDSVFASTLGKKASSVTNYMQARNLEYQQDLKAIWANNGKGLLIGYPGKTPEILDPAKANSFQIKTAQFQVANAACTSGKRLGELSMAVTRQLMIKQDGTEDACNAAAAGAAGTGDQCAAGSVAMLRVKIENRCLDCGSDVDKGFYLRTEHSSPGKSYKDDNSVFKNTFEFTGRKALACGSTGTFDIMLNTPEPDDKKHSRADLLPQDVKITIVSPCRETLTYMWMQKAADAKAIVAPSWLGSFWR